MTFENGIIDRSAPDAMRAWSRILGVTQAQILIAVAVVGVVAEDVRSYLAEPWPAPNPVTYTVD
jgi:hypothetical protein